MPRMKPRTKLAKRRKMRKVMDEYAAGKLRSGSKTGPKVTSRKQAIAIGMSESGQSRYGRKRKRGSRRD